MGARRGPEGFGAAGASQNDPREAPNGQCDWRAPNRVLVLQDDKNSRNVEVFRAHAAPQGMRDNLINALKRLTNKELGGDSAVKMVVPGLLEKSRHRTMDGAQEVQCSGQVCSSEDSRSGERDKVQESGNAKVPGRGYSARSGRAHRACA